MKEIYNRSHTKNFAQFVYKLNIQNFYENLQISFFVIYHWSWKDWSSFFFPTTFRVAEWFLLRLSSQSSNPS